jgi:hypothetical protein
MDPTIQRRLLQLEEEIAEGGAGAALSDGTPATPGSAGPGVGVTASRFDHIHPAMTVGTAHGLSIAANAISLANATISAAGAQSAADKIKLDAMPFISVKDPAYGAGAGGDDVAKILAAITAANSAGIGRVHLPEGTYVIDCQNTADPTTLVALIALPGSNMAITGDGPGRTVINVINATEDVGGDGVNVFGVTSKSNIIFDGLHFVGENDPFSYVLNNQGCCIRSFTSEDVLVRNCRFESIWGFSIHDDASTRVHVMDCTFIDAANGVNVNASWALLVRNAFSRSEGYELSGKHIVVMGSTFKQALGNAMSIGGDQSGDEFPGAIVVGNTVDGSTSVGMTITDGCVAAVIANNTIRGCENGGIIASVSNPSFPLHSCIFANNVIDSNCISGGSSAVGLSIANGDGKHLIYANLSTDRAVAGYEQKFALYLNAPNCVVSGNYFDGTIKDASFDVDALNTTEELNVFVNKNEEWYGERAPKRSSYNDVTEPIALRRLWDSSAGDDYAMFSEFPDGKHEWGPNTVGGVGVRDTNLYRSAADTLKTDDTFIAGTALKISTGAPQTVGAAAPAAGAHVVGEIVWNTSPTSGGTIGWVCTTAGTPGTWKTWGVIS